MYFILFNHYYLSFTFDDQVYIKLKWGLEYRGKLVSFDGFFNFQLVDTYECLGDGQEDTRLGEVLIRCNNVLYIRPVAQEKYMNAEKDKGKGSSMQLEDAESSSDDEN